ncbi:MAG: tetratricopeptide repeat protein [Halobacteriovoraceae bacterium]|nr:tetratricopeptide repeat protein [Halobacteriovoraceae bacterium]
MKIILSLITLILFSQAALSSVTEAWRYYQDSRSSTQNYHRVANSLMDSEMYLSAVPFVKEYLFSNKKIVHSEIDPIIERLIAKVGVTQFEILPDRILNKSKSPTIKYILAKKFFRQGKYDESINTLNAAIPRVHPIRPFALHLEASLYVMKESYENALLAFKDCVELSQKMIGDLKDKDRRREMEINRDYCIIGESRTLFTAKKHDLANRSYLNLPKSSYIWPEILFEEAWNSFYQRDYNRALGKLVTYKAPILNFIFNPEIDVLRALSYMELCLWNDTKFVVDDFYQRYEKDYKNILELSKTHRNDYKYYYLLSKTFLDGKQRGNELLRNILKDITWDPAFRDLLQVYTSGLKEIEVLSSLKDLGFTRYLDKSLRETLKLQRDLIGAYVQKRIKVYELQMLKSFEGMSYIKLEILGRKKMGLYNRPLNNSRFRGNINNVVKTDRQYFWPFKGEFWADELGDYVFSLKSECI